ncbi:endonuclease V [Candidatus Woesearchaeota archaeon]|nr:endonuclease V [Candidatus Woesearchaeota archaeon]
MMDIERLKEEQLAAARKVITTDEHGELKTFGGCDCAYVNNTVIAAIVVCDDKFKIIEKQTIAVENDFPYMPGLLYYREGKAIKEAFSKLKNKPDVLLVDGNGILHPLRCGLASQLGVELDQPTIGVAKTRLLGEEDEAGNIKVGKDIIGAEFKAKEHAKPIYISVGHRVSLETAMEVVQKTTKPPHKLPEPLHLAHRLADKARKEMEKAARKVNEKA